MKYLSTPGIERSVQRLWSGLFLTLLFFPALRDIARASADDLRQHLLVVYNRSAPDSERLAQYYAEKRQISADHILAIDCPDSEEIDRATYQQKIFTPIDDYLTKQGWLLRENATLAVGPKIVSVKVATRNDIWAIVLMRGVPLRIQNDPAIDDIPHLKPELKTNAACVDSELATLPTVDTPLNGPSLNPYYFTGYPREFDALDSRRLILVTRLDAPAASDVQRMIDESLTAEANRLTGVACLDARGIDDKNNPYILGDDWLRNALISLTREGWNIEFDNNPDLIPTNRPLNQIALYAGWYTQDAQGPFFQPPRRFATGAIAYHLHSFSATTVHSKTAAWVGPLLSAGAAATMGCVYEPYLDLTPHMDVFIDRLLQGYTFGEAAYMSQKGLSWMVTVIGDPLYRPFREKLPQALVRSRQNDSANRDWLELQQARLDFQRGKLSLPDLKKRLVGPGASEIIWEGYGDLLALQSSPANNDDILNAYRQALTLYMGAVDQIRVGLKIIRLHELNHKPELARAMLKQLMQRWPRDSAFYGLDAEVARVNTPPETLTNSSAIPVAVPVSPTGTSSAPAAPAEPTVTAP